MSNPTKIYNDYVRANLPSTMTFDSTTVRYDINNHSFFKFKKSNWYFKYITKFGYASLSAYAVNNFDPDLVFDFKQNYYRTGGTATTLSSAVTHARAGQATMVDSDGLLKWAPHNLLTRSEELNLWPQIGTGSVVVDNAVAPDGTTTAATLTIGSTNFLRYILSSGTYTAGDIITYSFWARSDTVTSIGFGINGGASTGNNAIYANLAVTSTWNLVEFEFTILETDASLYYIIGKQGDNPVNNQLGDIEIWHPHAYRSDLGGMVNNSATGNSYVPTTSSAVYLPRVGHHIYNGDAWVNEGVLHESEARTNLVTESNVFTVVGSSTVTANSGVSPTGETNAVLADTVASSNSNAILLPTYNVTAGTSCTVSFYVKNVAGNGFLAFFFRSNSPTNQTKLWFNLNTGEKGTQGANGGTTSVSDFGITDVGNGWYRLFVVGADSNQTILNSFIFSALSDNNSNRDGNGEVLIYGAQAEAGLTPSSYIPTSGSTVTRAAETLTVPAANLPYPTPVETTGTELVTNGTFDSNTNGWTGFNATLSVDSNRLKVTNTASFGQAIAQTFTTVSGKTYLVTGDLIAGNVDGYINVNEGQYGSGIFNGTSDRTSTDTSFSITFKAVSHITKITLVNFFGSIGDFNLWDNVSVKEINPPDLSIQMDGRISYADTGSFGTVRLFDWTLDSNNGIIANITTEGSFDGQIYFTQEAAGVVDNVNSDAFNIGINVPFNIASRHGSGFINGSISGTALTANTTPSALPDLSSTNLDLGKIFMGTIAQFRMWNEDLTDAGIEEAST